MSNRSGHVRRSGFGTRRGPLVTDRGSRRLLGRLAPPRRHQRPRRTTASRQPASGFCAPARARGRQRTTFLIFPQFPQLLEGEPALQVLGLSFEPSLSVHAQRSADFSPRGAGLIEAEQPRAALGDANRRCHGWRAPSSNLRPQAAGHFVESRKLRIPKLLCVSHGRLAEGGEFSRDVGPCCVSVDGERLRDLAVRTASLPQLECAHAALGDRLGLAASSAPGSALRV